MKNRVNVCRFLVLGIFIHVGFVAHGQVEDITPPSADGAALIRSINVPVNYYTGTVSVNIPLYMVKSRNIQVPIGLSYQSSGIKVDDIATLTGLGWRLSAGGRVTRMVRGKPDEDGYSEIAGSPNDGTVAANMNNWKESTFNERFDKKFDGEPDLFFYEIPGGTGSFVVDSDGEIHTTPAQNVRIEWINKRYASVESRFLITDDAGNRFYFDECEYTRSKVKDQTTLNSFCSTWLLTKIISQAGECVEFTYTQGTEYAYEIRNTLSTAHIWYDPFFSYSIDNVKDISTTITFPLPKYISSIKWNTGKVEFVTSSGRSDIGTRKLDEIKLYSGDTYLKSYRFGYGKFTNNSLLLARIDETDGLTTDPVCSFTYNIDQNLPARNTASYDHFGYYNGAHPLYDYPSISSISGRDYNPMWPYTAANILTEIKYKGGGKKTFVYEPNAFGSASSPTPWAGVRIKEVREYEQSDAQPHVTRYEYLMKNSYGSTVSSGSIYTSNIIYTTRKISGIFTPNTESMVGITNKNTNYIYDINGSSIGYAQVKEILPNGSYQVYHFTSFKDQADYQAQVYFMKSMGAVLQDWSFGDADLLPRSSKARKRGLLTMQESYDNLDRLVSRKRNYYNLDAPAKKQVLGYAMVKSQFGLDPEEVNLTLGVYNWDIQPLYLDSVVVESGLYNLPSSTHYTYNQDYYGITNITNRDVEGNDMVTTLRYPYDYANIPASTTHPMGQALRIMQQKNMVNAPVETVTLQGDKILGAELTTFRINNSVDSTIVADQTLLMSLKKPIHTDEFSLSAIQPTGAFSYDPRYETQLVYAAYDQHDNLVYSHDLYGRNKAYVYGYNNSLPIAEVQNAIGGASSSSEQVKTLRFAGAASPLAGANFEVAIDQEVTFTVQLILNDSIFPTFPSELYTVGFQLDGASSFFLESAGGANNTFTFVYKASIVSGSYIPRLLIETDPRYSHWEAEVTYDLLLGSTTYQRGNQVFHTSFEDKDQGLVVTHAKTGSQVHAGDYAVDTRTFAPGQYQLTYWTSSDNGATWASVNDTIRIEENTTSVAVGDAGSLIDEVRIMPQGASMSTNTYLPGVGLTSKTDANGKTIYYEYDRFGRLIAVRDNDRHLVTSYTYN